MKWLCVVLAFVFFLTGACNIQKSRVDRIQEEPTEESNEPNMRLHDIWVVTRINGLPLDRSSELPRVELYVQGKRVLGFDGCNEFQGTIEELTNDRLVFGQLMSTYRLCEDMSVSDQFHDALKEVSSYQLDGLELFLLNDQKHKVIAMRKVD
jgi:heat shock protein HslJ